MTKNATAMQIQESATLNAGHGCRNDGTCGPKSNRRKSITCPKSNRSVRLPSTPATSNASDKSRHISRDHQSDFDSLWLWRCPRSSTSAKSNATQDIAIKNALLSLNEPNAAP